MKLYSLKNPEYFIQYLKVTTILSQIKFFENGFNYLKVPQYLQMLKIGWYVVEYITQQFPEYLRLGLRNFSKYDIFPFFT